MRGRSTGTSPSGSSLPEAPEAGASPAARPSSCDFTNWLRYSAARLPPLRRLQLLRPKAAERRAQTNGDLMDALLPPHTSEHHAVAAKRRGLTPLCAALTPVDETCRPPTREHPAASPLAAAPACSPADDDVEQVSVANLDNWDLAAIDLEVLLRSRVLMCRRYSTSCRYFYVTLCRFVRVNK